MRDSLSVLLIAYDIEATISSSFIPSSTNTQAGSVNPTFGQRSCNPRNSSSNSSSYFWWEFRQSSNMYFGYHQCVSRSQRKDIYANINRKPLRRPNEVLLHAPRIAITSSSSYSFVEGAMPCIIRQNAHVSSWFHEGAKTLSICDCITKEVINGSR